MCTNVQVVHPHSLIHETSYSCCSMHSIYLLSLLLAYSSHRPCVEYPVPLGYGTNNSTNQTIAVGGYLCRSNCEEIHANCYGAIVTAVTSTPGWTQQILDDSLRQVLALIHPYASFCISHFSFFSSAAFLLGLRCTEQSCSTLRYFQTRAHTRHLFPPTTDCPGSMSLLCAMMGISISPRVTYLPSMCLNADASASRASSCGLPIGDVLRGWGLSLQLP